MDSKHAAVHTLLQNAAVCPVSEQTADAGEKIRPELTTALGKAMELKKPVHVSSITYGEDLQVTRGNAGIACIRHVN